MSEPSTKSHGLLIAESLAGAWRREPPRAALTPSEVAGLLPSLSKSGGAALAWWKLWRAGAHDEHTAAGELRRAYLMQTLLAARHERSVEGAFELLRSAGVEPVLVKGWAAARAYAEPGLRPVGDVDLCVLPGQFEAAKEVLRSPEGSKFWVDLHRGFGELDDADPEEIFARTRLVRLGSARVRVPCEEDHLRMLSVHALRHGAWRPVWLCDVAAHLESRAEEFDWQLLAGRGRRTRNWLDRTAGLAESLLGARLEGTPYEGAARRLPGWLVPAVLRQWRKPYSTEHESPKVMRSYFRSPAGALVALRRRWPDPIRATAYFDAPFNRFPRLPLQLCKFLSQSTRYLGRLPAELRASARESSAHRQDARLRERTADRPFVT